MHFGKATGEIREIRVALGMRVLMIPSVGQQGTEQCKPDVK